LAVVFRFAIFSVYKPLYKVRARAGEAATAKATRTQGEPQRIAVAPALQRWNVIALRFLIGLAAF
jgi:hypothetical protein